MVHPSGCGQVAASKWVWLNKCRPTLFFLEDTALFCALKNSLASIQSFLHFSLNESLGSGQFGLVNRGVWSSPHGNIDVALKTLNNDASQEDRVKFLQEAAIMGQFKHLNVVQLYGIIHGPPVSSQS